MSYLLAHSASTYLFSIAVQAYINLDINLKEKNSEQSALLAIPKEKKKKENLYQCKDHFRPYE